MIIGAVAECACSCPASLRSARDICTTTHTCCQCGFSTEISAFTVCLNDIHTWFEEERLKNTRAEGTCIISSVIRAQYVAFSLLFYTWMWLNESRACGNLCLMKDDSPHGNNALNISLLILLFFLKRTCKKPLFRRQLD